MEKADVQPYTQLRRDEVHPVCIMVGDPARAALAASLCSSSKLIRKNMGYHTYDVSYNGENMTIISHCIGCPQIMIVTEELRECGAKVLIRGGTCGSLKPDRFQKGDLVIPVAAARAADCVEDYIPKGFPCVATPEVTVALANAAKRLNVEASTNGIVLTHGLFYSPPKGNGGTGNEYLEMWAKSCDIVEMEASGLFAVGCVKGIDTGAIAAVDGSPIQWDKGNYDPLAPKVVNSKKNVCLVALEAGADLTKAIRKREV